MTIHINRLSPRYSEWISIVFWSSIPVVKFLPSAHFFRRVPKFLILRSISSHLFQHNCDFRDYSRPLTFREEQFRLNVNELEIPWASQWLVLWQPTYKLIYILKLNPKNNRHFSLYYYMFFLWNYVKWSI